MVSRTTTATRASGRGDDRAASRDGAERGRVNTRVALCFSVHKRVSFDQIQQGFLLILLYEWPLKLHVENTGRRYLLCLSKTWTMCTRILHPDRAQHKPSSRLFPPWNNMICLILEQTLRTYHDISYPNRVIWMGLQQHQTPLFLAYSSTKHCFTHGRSPSLRLGA